MNLTLVLICVTIIRRTQGAHLGKFALQTRVRLCAVGNRAYRREEGGPTDRQGKRAGLPVGRWWNVRPA